MTGLSTSPLTTEPLMVLGLKCECHLWYEATKGASNEHRPIPLRASASMQEIVKAVPSDTLLFTYRCQKCKHYVLIHVRDIRHSRPDLPNE